METPGINVLYVDDEINNLTAFSANFRRFFNVYTATSGLEGLAIINQYPINIVLVDQRMPDMSGIQFLEVVSKEHPNIIRMILTGFTDVETMFEAINTGRVFRYITKPWDERELKSTLENAARTYITEKQTREKIETLEKIIAEQENTISLYKRFTPAHLEPDILNATNVQLADGQIRVVSILFIEAVNFSVLISKMEPRLALHLLNQLLNFIENIVINNHGSIHKTLNARFCIIFGAPVSFIDNPLNALKCAFEIVREIKSFNTSHNIELEFSGALHFGEVVTGSTPLNNAIEYSIIGEPILQAKNLLDVAVTEPGKILLSSTMNKTLQRYDFTFERSSEIEIKFENTPFSYFIVKEQE